MAPISCSNTSQNHQASTSETDFQPQSPLYSPKALLLASFYLADTVMTTDLAKSPIYVAMNEEKSVLLLMLLFYKPRFRN
jgi:hypothetical protein